ncbi:MAG TPA: hypothetical protein VE978_06970 [Chitinophagales bacterium]|nr:hypothetical protein [Chitinophagales bacterium]
MKPQLFHVAFKCTYNNGNFNNGGEGRYIGFNGTCSNEIIHENVARGNSIWCGTDGCECKDFVYERNFQGERPYKPCYESTLFDEEDGWSFGAGADHTCDPPKARFIRKTEPGKIVMLTTRLRDEGEDVEKRRRIVGFFRIGDITEAEDKNEGTMLFSDGKYNIKFPKMIAKRTFFWDHYSNQEGEPHWGSGLYRYIDDEQMKGIITSMLAHLTRFKMEKSLYIKLERLLGESF